MSAGDDELTFTLRDVSLPVTSRTFDPGPDPAPEGPIPPSAATWRRRDDSGRALAEEAHAAGAVEQLDPQPNQAVAIELVVRGNLAEASRVALALEELAVSRKSVLFVGWTVTSR
jgi:hypothetical protein